MFSVIFPAHTINFFLALSQLVIFGIIGKALLNNHTTWENLAVCVATSVILEHVLLLITHKKLRYFSVTSLNTPFSTALMLASTNSLVYIPLMVMAVGQKYVLKIRGKHFQNPSNLLILAGMLVFPQYLSVNFMKLGIYWWLAIPLAAIGIFITYKVGIFHMVPAFVVAFLSLMPLLTHLSYAEILPLMFSLNFLLFAFYMQTDPKTIPSTPTFQVVHSFLTVAMIAGFYLLTHRLNLMFYGGLFMAQLFVPLWRYIEEKTPVDAVVTGLLFD